MSQPHGLYRAIRRDAPFGRFQAYDYHMVDLPLPRAAVGYGTSVARLVHAGLAGCCDAPRRMKLVTNGVKTEKCGNCGAEALRDV